jgi:cyclophilin family peptidyl-prolyl cis-trans isomerase
VNLALVFALAFVWLGAAVAAAQSPATDVRDALLRADDGRVTTQEQRQVVERALTSGSPEVTAQALRAIARTQRAEFLPSAIAALGNPSIDVRREAAFAIAHIGSGAPESLAPAERALREALGSETDVLVCAALAEEYGRLPFASAASIGEAARTLQGVLIRLGRDGAVATFVELGVARGAEALARRAVRVKADAVDVPALLTALYPAKAVSHDGRQDLVRARIRRLAVGGFLVLDRLPADRLDLALADPDDQVRRLGVVALARRPTLTAAQATTLLADSAVLVRHAVAARIGPKFAEVAEAATRDAHLTVRLAALDALGEAASCRTACSSRLDRAEAFAGAAWHEGAHALVALARTDADAARAFVARAAAAETWQVRMYAARAAAYTRQADVIARLAGDANVNVRHAALATWRTTQLPGLQSAALAALDSDDGQLVLEAVGSLRPGTGSRVSGTGSREPATDSREPATGNRQPGEQPATGNGRPEGQPATGNREPGTGGQRAAGNRVEVVLALRTTLARLTALRRDTSRDPRVALIDLIADLDADRATTLQPYLSDFDPFIAARVAELIGTRNVKPAASPAGSPSLGGRAGAGGSPAIRIPTWAEVEALDQTTISLRLRGGRALTMRVYASNAPTAAARLVAQVRVGEWNGRTFHRVEPGFVLQGGSPAANEYAGAAAFARDEFSALSHVRGTVGISTRGADTGDGQIFINLVDNARLDFAYTLVGAISGDTSLLDDIVEGEVIESATVVP